MGPRSMSESRCVQGLKTLGSDKSDFKTWNEKLLNVMAQTLGTGWREFMHNLNSELDRNRNVLDSSQVQLVEGFLNLKDFEMAKENL